MNTGNDKKNAHLSTVLTCKSMKVLVTTNVQVQLKAVDIEAAAPLMRPGKTSPIISQGMGPYPTEKETTYL